MPGEEGDEASYYDEFESFEEEFEEEIEEEVVVNQNMSAANLPAKATPIPKEENK